MRRLGNLGIRMRRNLLRVGTIAGIAVIQTVTGAFGLAQTSSTSITIAPPSLIVADRADGGSFGAAVAVIAVVLLVTAAWLAVRALIAYPRAGRREREPVATPEPEA